MSDSLVLLENQIQQYKQYSQNLKYAYMDVFQEHILDHIWKQPFLTFLRKKYQRKFKDVHKKRNSGLYWKNVIYAQIKYTYCYQLINIIFSLPVNTGWFEREYSTLEIICQKRQNHLDVKSLKITILLC